MYTLEEVRERSAYRKSRKYYIDECINKIQSNINKAIEQECDYTFVSIRHGEEDIAKEVLKMYKDEGYKVYPRPNKVTAVLSPSTGNYMSVSNDYDSFIVTWDSEFTNDKEHVDFLKEFIEYHKNSNFDNGRNYVNFNAVEDYYKIGEKYGLLD